MYLKKKKNETVGSKENKRILEKFPNGGGKMLAGQGRLSENLAYLCNPVFNIQRW